jgi:hypothetical protein
VPLDAPPVQHTAIDHEYLLVNGLASTFSVVDGDGSVEELDDRWVLTQGSLTTTIYKSAVMVHTVSERAWETAPEPFDPRIH